MKAKKELSKAIRDQETPEDIAKKYDTYFTIRKQLKAHIETQIELEIAQSEQDVSPFCKESDMTYSWKRQIGLFLRQ